MPYHETSVTTKYQATIPQSVRHALKVRPGEKVRWHVQHAMVSVSAPPRIKDPVTVLLNQIKKPRHINAVKLVRETRNELV